MPNINFHPFRDVYIVRRFVTPLGRMPPRKKGKYMEKNFPTASDILQARANFQTERDDKVMNLIKEALTEWEKAEELGLSKAYATVAYRGEFSEAIQCILRKAGYRLEYIPGTGYRLFLR